MSEDDEKKTGSREPEASFLIRIQYRQNASWQGTIQWLDQKKTKKFRSELELMMLINEATQTEHISWKNKEEVS